MIHLHADAAERLDASGSDSKELQVEVQNGSSQSWTAGYVKAEAFSKGKDQKKFITPCERTYD